MEKKLFVGFQVTSGLFFVVIFISLFIINIS